MVEFLIGVFVAFLIVLPIAYYSYKKHEAIRRNADVFASNGHANFYKGKPGKKPTVKLCKSIYERDDYTCQFPGCRSRVIEGNATQRHEYLKGFLGAKVGNVNHKIAYDIGGQADPDNLITTCQPHNLVLKNSVSPWAIALCRKNGWKINPRGLRVVAKWDEYK